MPNVIRLLSVLLALALAPLPAAEPPTVAQFFALPTFSEPKLSPDGKHLAVLGRHGTAEYLAVIELATMQPKPLGDLGESRLKNYWWKGEQTLLCEVENQNYITQFRTIDLVTGKIKELNNAFYRSNYRYHYVVHALPADPENVLVGNIVFSVWENLPRVLSKLNVFTGKVTRVEKTAGNIDLWFVDRQGQAVAAQGSATGSVFLAWRRPGEADWQRSELGLAADLRLEFLTVHADRRRLLAMEKPEKGTARLVVFDPDTSAKETLFQSPEVDPDELATWGDNDPAAYAIWHETDKPRLHYFDDEARDIMATVDRSLPDTVNVIVSASTDHSVLVIQSSNERVRGVFYLLNRKLGRLIPLGSMQSDLTPAQLATAKDFRFTARDGLVLTGQLTLPPGGPANPPALLYVGNTIRHDRSRRGYSPLFQLLASRGYAVVRINYRGMDGFGQEFAQAGTRQLGTGMPDDLADGMNFVIREGWVDGNRVGVIGSSTGGLVAFHSLLRTDQFKVWLNINTPMRSFVLRHSLLLPSARDDEEATRLLGGKSAVYDYLATIDPKPLLPKIKVPSFHYYYRSPDNTLYYEGEIAEKFFEKSPIPHDFLRGKPHQNVWDAFSDDYTRYYNAEQIAMAENMLLFLKKHLPTEGSH
ncbi:MAG TPA: prolyl oligopeptidase family serine peptidase [Lacunisphaera sp.]